MPHAPLAAQKWKRDCLMWGCVCISLAASRTRAIQFCEVLRPRVHLTSWLMRCRLHTPCISPSHHVKVDGTNTRFMSFCLPDVVPLTVDIVFYCHMYVTI